MFCPNCGTQNADTATTCSKCGFNLKGAAAPKFKGTMLMMNAPPQAPPRPAGGAGPTVPGGTAPPGTPGAPPPPRSSAAPPPPVGRAQMKGTMLGVAPPAGGAPIPPPATPPMASPGAGFPPAAGPPPGGPGAGFSGPVNPLGGTMVADPASMGVGGGYGPPAGGGQPPPPNPYGPPGGGQPGAHPNPYGSPPAAGGPYGQPPGPSPANPYDPPPPPAFGGPPAGPGGSGGYGGQPGAGGPGGYGGQPGAGGPGGYGGQPGAGGPGGYGGQPGAGGPGEYGGAGAGQSGPGGFSPPNPYGSPNAPVDGAPHFGMQPMQGVGQGSAPIVPVGGTPYASRGAHGPVGNLRNPMVVTLLGVICFPYLLFVMWSTINELKAFRQKDDINPIMFLVPVLNLLLFWKLPEKVLEAKQLAGIQNPQVVHPVLYLLLWPYFFTTDLNEIFQATGAQPGP